jgi:hypothetical protein
MNSLREDSAGCEETQILNFTFYLICVTASQTFFSLWPFRPMDPSLWTVRLRTIYSLDPPAAPFSPYLPIPPFRPGLLMPTPPASQPILYRPGLI